MPGQTTKLKRDVLDGFSLTLYVQSRHNQSWTDCQTPTSIKANPERNHITRVWGFSILHKDTLTCRPGESNQQPYDNKTLALPLSYSHPHDHHRPIKNAKWSRFGPELQMCRFLIWWEHSIELIELTYELWSRTSRYTTETSCFLMDHLLFSRLNVNFKPQLLSQHQRKAPRNWEFEQDRHTNSICWGRSWEAPE